VNKEDFSASTAIMGLLAAPSPRDVAQQTRCNSFSQTEAKEKLVAEKSSESNSLDQKTIDIDYWKTEKAEKRVWERFYSSSPNLRIPDSFDDEVVLNSEDSDRQDLPRKPKGRSRSEKSTEGTAKDTYKEIQEIDDKPVSFNNEKAKREQACDEARLDMIQQAELRFKQANDVYVQLRSEYNASLDRIRELEEKANSVSSVTEANQNLRVQVEQSQVTIQALRKEIDELKSICEESMALAEETEGAYVAEESDLSTMVDEM